MRRTLVAVLLVVVVAGCGGGGDDGGGVGGGLVDPAAKTTTTKPGGSSSTTSTTRPSTTTSSSSSTTLASTTTAPPTQTVPPLTQPPATQPPAQDHGPQAFRLPSGNIGCYLNADEARCDIAEHSWEPPPRPPTCDLDWGNGIVLDGDGAGFICAGDTVLGADEVLEYGSSSQHGPYLCESAQTGVTCHDTRNGAGFSLSRGDYRIF